MITLASPRDPGEFPYFQVSWIVTSIPSAKSLHISNWICVDSNSQGQKSWGTSLVSCHHRWPPREGKALVRLCKADGSGGVQRKGHSWQEFDRGRHTEAGLSRCAGGESPRWDAVRGSREEAGPEAREDREGSQIVHTGEFGRQGEPALGFSGD